ncbi:hypothetical protein [Pluralibacter gergoviae]|uniref:hypothetical protein n=1 Tax=Pluralibacter gergoviae TaxID=61647 RepID=UPI000B1C7FA2|nr:hypothetical protein [Pluralibacter gergoviae]
MRFFINPFWVFFSSFIFVGFLFELHLSHLYDYIDGGALKVEMYFILITSVFCAFFLHVFFIRKVSSKNRTSDISNNNALLIMIFIMVGSFVEFGVEKVIPLLSVLRGDGYEYKNFGIPTYHVFLVIYVMTSAVLAFNRYMLHGTKKNLLITIMCVFYSILIVNRGLMIMTVAPCVYMYLYYKANKKSLFNSLVFFFVIIFVFGYIGDKRMKSSGYTDENPIYRIGQIDSPILKALPSGFSWFYVYASSPIATLYNQETKLGFDRGDFFDYMHSTIIPDFIAKRFGDDDSFRYKPALIDKQLTVPTGFGVALRVYGYTGVAYTYLYLSLLIFIFAGLNTKGNIVPILAVLSSVSSLMIFSNMLNFSAGILPLLFITLLSNKIIVIGRSSFKIF